LVFAKRGYRGGISLARPAVDISLLDIVEAMEGEHWLGNCLLGYNECAKHSMCPTQGFWQRMRLEIISELSQISLAEVLAAKAVETKPAPISQRRAPVSQNWTSRPVLQA
jgi:Rrf2 family protein